jgi:hypothetical protein
VLVGSLFQTLQYVFPLFGLSTMWRSDVLCPFLVVSISFVMAFFSVDLAFGADARELQGLGVGHAHMDISCSPVVSRNFDTALALLHNFWNPRALSTFDQIIQADPNARWPIGALQWPTTIPLGRTNTGRWAKRLGAGAKRHESEGKVAREGMYIDAVAALYNNGGAGKKSPRDEAYTDSMATVYAKYPDDETKLFYETARGLGHTACLLKSVAYKISFSIVEHLLSRLQCRSNSTDGCDGQIADSKALAWNIRDRFGQDVPQFSHITRPTIRPRRIDGFIRYAHRLTLPS